MHGLGQGVTYRAFRMEICRIYFEQLELQLRGLLDGLEDDIADRVLGLGERPNDTQHGDADNCEELAEEYHGVS